MTLSHSFFQSINGNNINNIPFNTDTPKSKLKRKEKPKSSQEKLNQKHQSQCEEPIQKKIKKESKPQLTKNFGK